MLLEILSGYNLTVVRQIINKIDIAEMRTKFNQEKNNVVNNFFLDTSIACSGANKTKAAKTKQMLLTA